MRFASETSAITKPEENNTSKIDEVAAVDKPARNAIEVRLHAEIIYYFARCSRQLAAYKPKNKMEKDAYEKRDKKSHHLVAGDAAGKNAYADVGRAH